VRFWNFAAVTLIFAPAVALAALVGVGVGAAFACGITWVTLLAVVADLSR